MAEARFQHAETLRGAAPLPGQEARDLEDILTRLRTAWEQRDEQERRAHDLWDLLTALRKAVPPGALREAFDAALLLPGDAVARQEVRDRLRAALVPGGGDPPA